MSKRSARGVPPPMVLKEKHLEYDLESLHSPIYIYEPLEKPRHPPPCPPRPLAATTGPFTLNALVALLATVGKGAMLSTVGLCMAQLKWARFATRGGGGSKDPVAARPLSEFCSIDQASCGPVGSLAALPAVFAMPLVLMGALIMVIAVGFDFAAQQFISLEPRAVQPAGEPFVPRAQFFYNDESGGQAEYIRTVFAAGKGLVTTIDKGCGGDPGVLDVAATKCVSIRDQLSRLALEPAPGDSGAGRNDSTVYEIKWTAPGNATVVQRVVGLNNDGSTLNQTFVVSSFAGIQWPAPGWPDYAVAPLGLTIMKFRARALAADAVAAPPIGAWQCGISLCVRTLAVSVVNGRQRTAVLAEYDNDTQLATAATATRPNISRAAKFLIKDDENTPPPPPVLRPNMLSEFEVSYAGVVRGVATTQQVFVSVAWVWLSLPAALVACAALLLPATAVYSSA
ncbi:hypothetical protein RB600_001663 [Gaeumannomyces tritici]